MAKLGFETKAEFQRVMFGRALDKLLEGGNLRGRNVSLQTEIEDIVLGLSRAWDQADERRA